MIQKPGVPWGIARIQAPQAWRYTTGYRIKIGVIDTGVDFSHPDLSHSLGRGINFIEPMRPPTDDNGHGTHIAGTIAAANELRGMIGVAPRSIVYPIKAFDHNGSAYVSDILLGIEWCVKNKMDIINMSFGMKKHSKALLQAVQKAYEAGIIIVASSGNDGKRKSIDYPASYSQTVAVGATTRARKVAPFSNNSDQIDIYAPGEHIPSSWLNGKYNDMSGTSMATSHVSGAIALLLSYNRSLKPDDIKAIVKKSNYAKGEVDVIRMLRLAKKLHPFTS